MADPKPEPFLKQQSFATNSAAEEYIQKERRSPSIPDTVVTNAHTEPCGTTTLSCIWYQRKRA